ncbi:HK97 gp10 family phage protein [Brevibacterium sp. JNUCC-42]|nr:HK97 gp10 family phage protein [Brevibacterium sp. JNUCC-42]
MAGSFDMGDFERLAKAFQKADRERVVERFIRDFLLEMAYRAERKIKKRTPVDEGELRRNWRVGNVDRHGNAYVVELINLTEYAPFVEYGHRTRGGGGWVEGRFMMTISMKEIEKEFPTYLEKRQVELLNDIMNGRPARRGDSN